MHFKWNLCPIYLKWKYEDKVWSELYVGTYIFITTIAFTEHRVNDTHTYTYTLHYLKCNLKNISCYCMPAFQRLRKYSLLFTEKRIKCNSTIHLDLFAPIVTLWVIAILRYLLYTPDILNTTIWKEFGNSISSNQISQFHELNVRKIYNVTVGQLVV